MGSTGRGRGGGAVFPEEFFVSEAPRFFKVMTKPSLDHRKLAIPPMFIKKYGNDLSDAVLLKAPGGELFQVKIERAEGKVWLGVGWRRFQDNYSLDEGSVLVFELEGNNILNVLIFDSSCTEIEYPVEDGCHEALEISDYYLPSRTEENGYDYSVESRAADDPKSKRRFQHKPSKPSTSRHPLETDDDSGDQTESESISESESEAEYEPESEWESEPISESDSESEAEYEPESESGSEYEDDPEHSGVKKRAVRPPQKQVKRSRLAQELAGTNCKKPRIVKKPLPPSSHRALQVAKQCQSQYPSFPIRLRPSYMRSGGVSICATFMRKNKFKPGESFVKLMHRGQLWSVKMCIYPAEHRGKLCTGWSEFLEDNALCNGDVCVFELVEKDVFDVRFFRCSSY